jgi:hypothetical protein
MENPNNIYNYTDYISYLRDFYVWKKEVSPGFSYRVYSRCAEVKASNFLQWLIEGNLMDLYLADSSLNFNNTLAIDTVTFSDLKSEHFFVSALMKLEEFYGDPFILNIWKEVDNRPVAVRTRMAVDNLILASSAAAHVNLISLFLTWKYPVSESAKNEASKLHP